MSVATATILSGGKAIKPEWELLSLTVSRELNRIPTASLVYADETQLQASGPVKKSPFGISGSPAFQPGAKIEIKLRHEEAGDEVSVFKGVVIRHGIEADANGCRLMVELKDAAVRMTIARNGRVFHQVKDSDVIQTLAREAGLASKIAATTDFEHPELVQYDCTDWDFALARAEANGLVLLANDGQVELRKIAIKGLAHYRFDFDLGQIDELEMEMDAGSQFPSVKSLAWDPAKQVVSAPAKGAGFTLKQSNLKGDEIAHDVGFHGCTLFHPVPMEPDELRAWADGRVARSRLAFLRGRFAVAGLGKLKLLDLIQLKNVGDRFSGETVVTGLRHSMGMGGWRTDIQFGLSPRRISEEEGFLEPPASGLLPSAGGLQIGVVKKISEDPAKQFRVQVQLVTMDGSSPPIWARWASPDAASGSGSFFLPDVGGEVVVGFLDSDPRHPIILGALFSSKNPPPEPYKAIDEKNIHKGFVTRKGTRLSFVDEDKPSVSIETPAGNKVLLDDKAESITLTDKHTNTITLDKNGIQLKSAKDLKLEASGNVTIKGAKVDVQ